ncbi:MAG: class I SAM-dependent RNA methyltransferase [Gemmatimonadales bacterium]
MSTSVRIERIAAGGDGVGRLADGRVVFVPRTAPGDLAVVSVVKEDKRFARARLDRLEEPGPGRVAPECPHYEGDRCGGCQLQHLSLETQTVVRRGILIDALERIAKTAIEVPPIEPAADPWGYRAKMALTVGPTGKIGYHQVGRPDAVFALERCAIASPVLNDLWRRLDRQRTKLPRAAVRLVLRLDRDGGEHLIVETGAGPIWTGGKALWEAVKAARPLTIWWQPHEGAARAVGGTDTAYPATAFEQIHPAMGDRVRRHAIECLGPVADRRIWDLYSGIGETSSALAEAGAAAIISVERDRRAVEEAERRQAAHERRIERIVGAAERVVGSLGRVDLVITNPPRVGMDGEVVRVIRARGPSRVVYISCDPATLARDVARFRAPGAAGVGYRLTAVRGFDLFPQTAHLETVAVLECE